MYLYLCFLKFIFSEKLGLCQEYHQISELPDFKLGKEQNKSKHKCKSNPIHSFKTCDIQIIFEVHFRHFSLMRISSKNDLNWHANGIWFHQFYLIFRQASFLSSINTGCNKHACVSQNTYSLSKNIKAILIKYACCVYFVKSVVFVININAWCYCERQIWQLCLIFSVLFLCGDIHVFHDYSICICERLFTS